MDALRVAPSTEVVRTLLEVIAPGSSLQAMDSLPGSFSNATHLVDAVSATGASFRIVIRRYAEVAGYDGGEKARREYRTLELLQAHGIPVPQPLYLDRQGTLLGTPGIVTSFVSGRPVIAPADPVPWAQALAMTLARIHAIPCDPAAADFLLDANTEVVWFLRSGAVPGFMTAHDDGTAVWQAVRDLVPWMRPVPPALVHIDYWPGNILWREGQIAAVVDWEEAACGDPGIDVAYGRMNLLLLGLDTAAETFLHQYEAELGRRVENLGLWELAAAARAMPDPAEWIPEWDALGEHHCTASSARQRLRQFIADAWRRAGL